MFKIKEAVYVIKFSNKQEVVQVVIEVDGDERSQKKHHVVDTEGAALYQNAVARVFLNI